MFGIVIVIVVEASITKEGWTRYQRLLLLFLLFLGDVTEGIIICAQNVVDVIVTVALLL